MPSIPHDLAAFLVEAKRRTYAGLDDDATVATPLLAGSKPPRDPGFNSLRKHARVASI
ncbi:hypothetical protein [uncultured Bradyrhizobium sp.]|jgi:hypothetical protein|uniref:hypothetical protein n=1 Tax=uncultured Bradyrhizobium sp. TaxID=199684 RepID=UPI00262F5E48|nr:hypothetical protein [uncultured Bradyrhizobium sp.]